MIIITHTLATLLLLKMFSVNDPNIIFMTFLFGIGIDLDEPFIVWKKYRELKDWEKFKKWLKRKGTRKRNFFDESGGLVVSLIFSYFLNNYVPFLANLLHCTMDWMCDFESRPLAPFYNKLRTRGPIESDFRSLEEKILILILLVALIVV